MSKHEVAAANREFPFVGQSVDGRRGIFVLTSSTTPQSIAVPPGWLGNYVGIISDVDAQFTFATGSSAPPLAYNSGSSVAANGSVTSSWQSGIPLKAGVMEEGIVPESGQRLPEVTGSSYHSDRLPTNRFTYVSSAATGYIRILLLQGQRG